MFNIFLKKNFNLNLFFFFSRIILEKRQPSVQNVNALTICEPLQENAHTTNRLSLIFTRTFKSFMDQHFI